MYGYMRIRLAPIVAGLMLLCAVDAHADNTLPDVEQARQLLKGVSPIDTTARLAAGFMWLQQAAQWQGEYAAAERYKSESAKAFSQIGPLGAKCYDFYELSDDFLGALLDTYFTPEWQRAQVRPKASMMSVWARAVAAASPARRAFPPAPSYCTPEPAAPKAKAGSVVPQPSKDTSDRAGQADSGASGADSAIEQDLKDAGGHVDMKFFGISFGKPLTSIAACPGSGGEQAGALCRERETTDDGDVMLTFTPGKAPSWMTSGRTMDWYGAGHTMYVTLKGGLVVAVSMPAAQTDELFATLKEKYGDSKDVLSIRRLTYKNRIGIPSQVEEWQWRLRGLHVKFAPNEVQQEPQGALGRLTIELASYRRAQDAAARAKKASLPKL